MRGRQYLDLSGLFLSWKAFSLSSRPKTSKGRDSLFQYLSLYCGLLRQGLCLSPQP